MTYPSEREQRERERDERWQEAREREDRWQEEFYQEQERKYKEFDRAEREYEREQERLREAREEEDQAAIDATAEGMSDIKPNKSPALYLQKLWIALRKKGNPELILDHTNNSNDAPSIREWIAAEAPMSENPTHPELGDSGND